MSMPTDNELTNGNFRLYRNYDDSNTIIGLNEYLPLPRKYWANSPNSRPEQIGTLKGFNGDTGYNYPFHFDSVNSLDMMDESKIQEIMKEIKKNNSFIKINKVIQNRLILRSICHEWRI